MRPATLIRAGLLVGAVLALEAACRGGLISRQAVIPPSEMVRGAWRVLGTEEARGTSP